MNDSRINPAWGPFFTHEYLLYPILTTNSWLMNLKPISVQANPNWNDWPIGPNHKDKFGELAKKVRDLPVLDTFDCIDRNSDFDLKLPENTQINPWLILLLYCTEPDHALDHDLDLHPSQKLMKGSHGYRHMEFSLFGKKFGQASRSFAYYFDAAKETFEIGNTYWGWRFLARSTHYLADLVHPYHVKVLPYRKLLVSLHKPKKMFQILATMHNSHEVYVQYRFRTGFQPFSDALRNGATYAYEHNEDPRLILPPLSKQAANRLTPIYKIQEQFGQELIDAYAVVHDHNEMDAAKSTILAEKESQRILFQPKNESILKQLDEITMKSLFDVGRLYGALLNVVQKEFST
jgi:hypothetical protein